MLTWLLQEGPKADKHRSRAHPLVTFFLHYSVVAWVTVAAHDWMTERWPIQEDESLSSCVASPATRRQSVGTFLGVYFCVYFSLRLALRWHHGDFYIEFYKQTFLCSVTIFHAALGFYTHRPILAQAFCVAVGIDQLLWYVDLAGYLTLNKFLIGVSKYLFWPGTTWASRLTSTHHLWTIPLVLWASGGSLHVLALPLSAVVVFINVLLSRLLTPHSIAASEQLPAHYLNLNLAYELWSDIRMPFLLVFEDTIPYLMRLFVAWCSFNAVVFVLLSKLALWWNILLERILGVPATC